VSDDDSTSTPTLLERMISARISEERALRHITEGHVHVDGQAVTNPDRRGGTRVVIGSQ
jgi:hypothetical protein